MAIQRRIEVGRRRIRTESTRIIAGRGLKEEARLTPERKGNWREVGSTSKTGPYRGPPPPVVSFRETNREGQ